MYAKYSVIKMESANMEALTSYTAKNLASRFSCMHRAPVNSASIAERQMYDIMRWPLYICASSVLRLHLNRDPGST